MDTFPVLMTDETWDAFVALKEPLRSDAIDLLCALTEGPDIEGQLIDEWGEHSVVIRGCLFTFSLRVDDSLPGAPDGPYVYVVPPIIYAES